MEEQVLSDLAHLRHLTECDGTPMTYRGYIQNGVVVLQDAPILPDGTPVRVETESADTASLRPGTPAAALQAAGTWQGKPGELDSLLDELRKDKWAEAEAERDR